PGGEDGEQLVGGFLRDVLLAQGAREPDRLPELGDVLGAVGAARDVPVEALAVTARERAVEVVGDELHELSAGEISHRRPGSPRGPRAPSSARGEGALVGWSRRAGERYEPRPSSSLRRRGAGSPVPAAAAASRLPRRSPGAPRSRAPGATA